MTPSPDDEWAAWRRENAAKARRALADPAVRAELLALLGLDDEGRAQARRIEAARSELAGLEARWKVDDEW